MRKWVFIAVVLSIPWIFSGCILLNEDGTRLSDSVEGVLTNVGTSYAGPLGFLVPGIINFLSLGAGALWQKVRHNRTVKTVNNLVDASMELKDKYPEAYALLKNEVVRRVEHNPTLREWSHNLIKRAKGEKV